MPKFIIRAHYNPGVVRLGTVEATNKHHALSVAEEMGLLDDPEADDFTADLAPATGDDLRKILANAIHSRSDK